MAYAVLFTNVSSAVSAHVAHPQTPCPPLKKVKFSCLVGLLQVITLKEWPTLDPLPRPKRHVCSFRRSTKRYIAVEVTFMGTGGDARVARQRRFNSFRHKRQNRKGKSQMQQPPPPPLPLCNDSDSWKTNLAIKEGNEGRERATGRRKRSEEKRAEGEGEIELDFPTFFCLFGAKKKTRPRGE